MRSLPGAFAAVLAITGICYAAQTEGRIRSIDKDAQTITLEDGKSYKLPGEFDVASLKEGMNIVIAFDEVSGEKLITDMELPE